MHPLSPPMAMALAMGCLVPIWIGLLAVCRFASGWNLLARHYPMRDKFQGDIRPWRFLILRTTTYRNFSNIGIDQGGFHLALRFPFILFHPPLYIPFDDVITIRQSPMAAESGCLITVKNAESVHIIVSRADGEAINQAFLAHAQAAERDYPVPAAPAAAAASAQASDEYFLRHARRQMILGAVFFVLLNISGIIINWNSWRVIIQPVRCSGSITESQQTAAARTGHEPQWSVTYGYSDRAGGKHQGEATIESPTTPYGLIEIVYCGSDPGICRLDPELAEAKRSQIGMSVAGLFFLWMSILAAIKYRSRKSQLKSSNAQAAEYQAATGSADQ